MSLQGCEERVVRVRRADDAENFALQIGEVFDLGFVGGDDHHGIFVQDRNGTDPLRSCRIAANDRELRLSLREPAECLHRAGGWDHGQPKGRPICGESPAPGRNQRCIVQAGGSNRQGQDRRLREVVPSDNGQPAGKAEAGHDDEPTEGSAHERAPFIGVSGAC